MLKSLFESSIDKLHISADMKDAIKKINNVCLEAEEQDKDKDKDLGYTPMSDEDKKKAKKIKDDEKKKEEENSREKDPASEKEDVAATHNFDYKTHNYNVFPDPAEKDKKPASEEKKQKEDSKEDKEDKGTKVEKGATREPEQVRTDGAQVNPNETAKAAPEAAPKAAPKYRADVATVQFFLNATEPNKKLAADGMLGPRTISAIQETEGRKPTGKMDKETQELFNKLLAEAKEKVKAVQAKLGVTQDGLIGKQTLAALQKANMQVASVFSDNPQVPANAQPAQQQVAQPQQAQPQQQAQNVTSIKFNEAQAQQFLKNKTISQQEYNIWKQYGIAPIFQRQNPQGTQTQIAAMQQKQKEVNTGAPVGKSVTSIPFNEAQAQQQLKSNQIKQQEYNIWKQYGIAPIFQRKNPQGTQAQIAKVQQGNKQQPQQQQQAAQPQQQAQQQQAPQQQQAQQQPQNPKQPQGSTQYLSGNISYMNLPPDEKKVYDDAEKKAQAEYLKKGNNEQTAYTKAQMNAQVAVLRYRQKKGKKG